MYIDGRVAIRRECSESLLNFKRKNPNPGVHKVSQPHRFTEKRYNLDATLSSTPGQNSQLSIKLKATFLDHDTLTLFKQNFIQKFYLRNRQKEHCLNQSLRLELDYSVSLPALGVHSNLPALLRNPEVSMYHLKTNDPN